MKFIAIYARVSSEKQARKGYSVKEQIHILKEHIKRIYPDRKYLIYVDKGYTGRNTERPDYKRMINDLKVHTIDIIVVVNTNRLHRNLEHFNDTVKIAKKNYVKIESLDMDLDFSKAGGKFTANVKALVDELDSDQISDATMRGIIGGLREGKYPIGKIPFGFKRNENKVLVFDEEKISVINSIIYDYINSLMSYRQLSIKYDLSYNRIFRIFNDNIYRGFYIYKGEVFKQSHIYLDEKAIRSIDMKKNIYSKQNRYIYLFKKKLLCSSCNNFLECKSALSKNKIFLYYQCTCKSCEVFNKRINEEHVKKLLINEIDIIILGNKNLLKNNKKTLAICDELQKYQNEIKEYNSKRKRIINLYVNDKISEKEYDELISKNTISINKLENTKNDRTSKIRYDKYLLSIELYKNLNIYKIDITKMIII